MWVNRFQSDHPKNSRSDSRYMSPRLCFFSLSQELRSENDFNITKKQPIREKFSSKPWEEIHFMRGTWVAIFSLIPRNSACLGLFYTAKTTRLHWWNRVDRPKLTNILQILLTELLFKMCSSVNIVLIPHLSWISKPFWKIFTNTYAVLCVPTGSRIQNCFLVCTLFAFTVYKEFKQQAEFETLFYAPSVVETSPSLQTVISTLYRQTFASTVCWMLCLSQSAKRGASSVEIATKQDNNLPTASLVVRSGAMTAFLSITG